MSTPATDVSDNKVTDQRDDGFLERLKIVLQRVGQLQKAALLTGYSTEQIAKWRDGRAKAPFKPLAILATEAGVSMDWLAGREELPKVAEPGASVVQGDVLMVDLLNVTASAGPGRQNHSEEVLKRLPFSAQLLRELGGSPETCHFIRQEGDSMFPTIPDGAISLVDTSKQRGDGIFAVCIGDEVRVKRLHFGARGLTLISDNADKYPPEMIGPDQIEQVRIVGRVLWSARAV